MDARNNLQQTALFLVSARGYPDVVSVLLGEGKQRKRGIQK